MGPPSWASGTMWRSVAALLLLLAAPRCHASVFSEAGGSRAEAPSLEELEAPVVTAEDDSEAFQSGGEYPTSEDLEQAAKEFLAAHYDETREEISDADLEKIVDELTRQEQERAEREPPLFEQQTVPVAEEQPKEAPAPAPQAAEKVEAEVAPSVEPEEEKKPLVAQKKGQNEFVSFVEPAPARQLKSGQSLDKRRPVESTHSRNNHQASHDMNLFFVAVGTVLVVGTVGGVVGGGLYFMRRRETPDDGEFAPYAGTGPGSKRGLKAGGPKGDESLAYKAQLHHYQQAKQKIICGDDGTGVNLGGESEESGAEDADEEENNFSVYECPGLAPTGDIEVHNPNFAPDH